MKHRNTLLEHLIELKSDNNLTTEQLEILDSAIRLAKKGTKTSKRNAMFLIAKYLLDYYVVIQTLVN